MAAIVLYNVYQTNFRVFPNLLQRFLIDSVFFGPNSSWDFLIESVGVSYIYDLIYPQKKKSHGNKSGECDGRNVSLPWSIHL